jgi:hypothetical protein
MCRDRAPGGSGGREVCPFLRQRNGEVDCVVHFDRRRQNKFHLRPPPDVVLLRLTSRRQALVSSVGTSSGPGSDAATAWGDTSA